MQQERWRRVDEIFHSVLKLDLEKRAAFLEQTCSGDSDLRLEVERLLIHYNESDSFLEEPALELAAHMGRTHTKHEAMEGEIVSHYRVGARLG